MRQRTRIVLVILVASLVSAVILASPAAALKRCPPVRTVAEDSCVCAAQNYSASPDQGVVFEIFTAEFGPFGTSAPLTLDPGKGTYFSFSGAAVTCGCKVTGEGAATRVSLSVHGTDGRPLVTVECR
jgi:hypothetical protein